MGISPNSAHRIGKRIRRQSASQLSGWSTLDCNRAFPSHEKFDSTIPSSSANTLSDGSVLHRTVRLQQGTKGNTNSYCHLFPDVESDASGKDQGMFGIVPKSKRAAGTDPVCAQKMCRKPAEKEACPDNRESNDLETASDGMKIGRSWQESSRYPTKRSLSCWTLRKNATACRQKRE